MIVSYNFNIPVESGEPLNIPLEEGSLVFVLGANGVGKSVLMSKICNDNYYKAKAILGNRQISLSSGTPILTASSREESEGMIKALDSAIESRYRDDSSSAKNQVNIFDLIEFENIRARKIANFVKNNDIQKAVEESKKTSYIEDINEIFRLSNMLIQIKLEDNGKLFVKKNGGEVTLPNLRHLINRIKLPD